MSPSNWNGDSKNMDKEEALCFFEMKKKLSWTPTKGSSASRLRGQQSGARKSKKETLVHSLYQTNIIHEKFDPEKQSELNSGFALFLWFFFPSLWGHFG